MPVGSPCCRTNFTLATFKSCVLSQVIQINLYCFLLQDNPVPKNLLQLVGTTAIFIASKYEERLAPHIGNFAYVTDHAYTKLEIRQMEVKILQALDFGLSFPLPPHFLRRISHVSKVMLGKCVTVSNIWKSQYSTVAGC